MQHSEEFLQLVNEAKNQVKELNVTETREKLKDVLLRKQNLSKYY